MGYLAGAMGARSAMARIRPTSLVRAMMLAAACTFLACALRLGFPWFLFWRFLSGLSGGLLMVAVPPTVLAAVRSDRRGRIGGIMFAGVGIGIVAAGTLVPQLLRIGLVATWLGLGLLALLLTAWARPRWPDDAPLARALPGWPTLVVTLVYALFALGLVPHMVFLVDFVARGLGWGVATGAVFWVLFGLGAVAGPFAAGWLGDRQGFARGLSIALALQLAVVLIPVLAPHAIPLAVSALVMGAFTPGMPALVLGRLAEVSYDRDGHAAWALATTAFALTQAAGAYGYSWLYAQSHGYAALFMTAALALGAALVLSLARSGRRS